MVRQREKDNPRFGFLLPWNALHSLYRQRAAAVLGATLAAELFNSGPSASTPAAGPPAIPPGVAAASSAPATAVDNAPAAEETRAENTAGGESSARQPVINSPGADQEADLEALSSAAAESSGGAGSSPGGSSEEMSPTEAETARTAAAAADVLLKPATAVRGLVGNPSLAPAGVRRKRLWDVIAADAGACTRHVIGFISPEYQLAA